MVVGVLRLDIRLYDTQSLKQKRSQVNKITARLRSRYPVSVAEVGCQDLLQRAVIGLSMTAGSESQLESVFHKVESEIESCGFAELLDTDVEFLHYGEDFS
ncbi:hypothetical protein SAMN02745165_02715 [Malonomonas rubra DSM 5091]|uniref:DUF503 domain-containing protein n=1 Tax=Malonomonas rubra DSM 5091 TaxID=1122189 RepID=A0A1M6KH01_MALRU|nr:DUF503 domain-containing protein [Malonomonas rubra]SHJ58243.1 hypothetical protein SAMN02745165_02715 [Malonomonas rubra DSM 5091]